MVTRYTPDRCVRRVLFIWFVQHPKPDGTRPAGLMTRLTRITAKPSRDLSLSRSHNISEFG